METLFDIRWIYITYFLILVLCISSFYARDYESLRKSAFCQDAAQYRNRLHPTDLPEQHIPWIWDAVYDPIFNVVELTTMNRSPCKFRVDQWKHLVKMFPQYVDKLGYGLDTNILVPFDYNFTIKYENYLLSSRVTCEYLDEYDNVVHTGKSLRIRGKSSFTGLGTLQIRCPIPQIYAKLFSRVRIRLQDNRDGYLDKAFANTSYDVPVCRIPLYLPSSKMHDLSICAATSRANRTQLVEWIEYYRLIGVDHFFIYDTFTSTTNENYNRNKTSLAYILRDYVRERIVTVVPWQFTNCVRHMANGRIAIWFENDVKYYFQSPKAIAQSAALASCYSRYKHTSRYMIHVDDDEFFSYSIPHLKQMIPSISPSSNLINIADNLFEMNPKTVAIRFEPAIFYPCNITQGILCNWNNNSIAYPSSLSGQVLHTPLPRLGVWDISEPYYRYEAKLLMRTAGVGMFFIHYVSLFESGEWNRGENNHAVTLPLTHLSMLHYKYPSSLSQSILEEFLPLSPASFEGACHWVSGLGNNKHIYYAQIDYNLYQKLVQNYNKRILSQQ